MASSRNEPPGPVTIPPPEAVARLRRRLLAWFARRARDLPWRRQRDVYPIWISEVMLQQTTVAAVIPFFERFLARFPDLQSLAAAEEHDVLRLWEGLGYYRRARDLHRSARLLCAEHGGQFPTEPALLGGLPGFGRYTTNAVLSQAFDARLPIVEANSRRVLCRLLGVRGDPTSHSVQKSLWDAAETLLPRRRVGDFNQALMEIGALVCTPTNPSCDACPLRPDCYAARHDLQADIPTAATKTAGTRVDEVAVVLRRGQRVLLGQRPPHGRWGNMWEFPHGPRELLESAETTAARLSADLGFRAAINGAITTVRHTVTRFHITMTCLEARVRSGSFRPGAYVQAVWLEPGELHAYPLSVPQRRLASYVE